MVNRVPLRYLLRPGDDRMPAVVGGGKRWRGAVWRRQAANSSAALTRREECSGGEGPAFGYLDLRPEGSSIRDFFLDSFQQLRMRQSAQ